jgi:hypothetical protein
VPPPYSSPFKAYFPRTALPFGAASPPPPPTGQQQSVDVINIEEEGLKLAYFHKRIYAQNKTVFNKSLAQCLTCLGSFLLITVRLCSLTVINNSVSNKELIASAFLEKSTIDDTTPQLAAQSSA